MLSTSTTTSDDGKPYKNPDNNMPPYSYPKFQAVGLKDQLGRSMHVTHIDTTGRTEVANRKTYQLREVTSYFSNLIYRILSPDELKRNSMVMTDDDNGDDGNDGDDSDDSDEGDEGDEGEDCDNGENGENGGKGYPYLFIPAASRQSLRFTQSSINVCILRPSYFVILTESLKYRQSPYLFGDLVS